MWPVTVFCMLKTMIVYLYLYLDGEAFINSVNYPHIKKHPYGMMVYCMISVSFLTLGHNVWMDSNFSYFDFVYCKANLYSKEKLF